MKKFLSLISVVLIVAMFFVGCDGINVNINGDVNGNMNGNVNAGQNSGSQNGGTTQTPENTSTEKPTEELTEAPTQETTEAPTQETTEAPTQETTEAPTQENTEGKKEETTETPVATNVSNAHVVKEDGRFRFTFSMIDKNQQEIAAAGSVKIKIVNESGITVYEATEGINANNYQTWYWDNGSGSFLGASVYVYRNDIMPSVAARGTFYFTIMSSEDKVLHEVAHVVAYELPQSPYPDDETPIAIADAINLALQLPNRGNASTQRYLIEGTVVSIEHETYGNMYVTDGEGNTIYVYGLYEQDGTRFDSMQTQPKAGDKVLLYGILCNFDKAEMKNAWLISCQTPGEETTEAPTQETTEAPTQETTEDPTQETTEDPTQETTEAPTQETTENNNEETTEAPVATNVSNAHVVKEDGRYRFTFSLIDQYSQEMATAVGSVNIKIVNESGITVYESTAGYNSTNFQTWNWDDGSGSFVGASVYVYRDDITPSVAARGTFYFTIMSSEDKIIHEFSYVVAYELPQSPYPDGETPIAIADAINLALQLPNKGNASMQRYLIEGTVVSIDSETYGNMYVTDGEGNTIYVYGLYDQNGVRYDAMESRPEAGDTVRLYGILCNFDKAEMKNAWLISCQTPEEDTNEEPGGDTTETTAPENTEEEPNEEIEVPTESVTLSCGGNFVSGTHYYYENPNNASVKKWELAMVATTEEALALNMVKNNDGSIYIKSGEMYLYCDGNDVVFVSQPEEYCKFYLERTESGTGYFIRTLGMHGEDYKYLEVYMGYLTCYTMQPSNADIYTFTLGSAQGAAGTIVGGPNA